ALETLEIYAPIAARLGMGRLKGQLEDMAFPYVYPAEYTQFIKKVKEKYKDVGNYLDRTKPLIKRYLSNSDIKVLDMHSRAKHFYSLYQKTERKGEGLDKIYDLVAMRIILPDIKSCYEALGVIHKHYKPLPGLIKDYIAFPKPNGYQSLHTTIFCEKGKIVEVQIRTENMHEFAENGIAAHWSYGESGKIGSARANLKEIQWVTQLKKMLNELQPEEGLSNIKIDFFKNRIFAFTPKGDVKELPEGATPVDFAYSIHGELGHLVKGARVNGKIVTLDYELKNGDVVEIMKGKEPRPSFDWLKFVKTAEAKKKIRSWYKEKAEGQESRVEKKRTRSKSSKLLTLDPLQSQRGEPIIQGQRGLLYKFARCCNPTTSHKIKGYMTLNRGVSIHTADCSNVKGASSARILTASWNKKS
ncbi:MAG: TGS domain-containing protein, partial [Candidatus Paceibacterota bacterium]